MHHARMKLFEAVAPCERVFNFRTPFRRKLRSLTDEWPDIKRTRARPMEMDGFDLFRLD